MSEKVVKTKKDHTCCYCHCVIEKGSNALFINGKQPRYYKDEIQIGIEYLSLYYHYDPESTTIAPCCEED